MPPARRPAPLPAAVLFDWDGTLVDTIPMIYRANVVALREFGPVDRAALQHLLHAHALGELQA